MAYSITDVKKTDKKNNIYSVTVSNGTKEVTVRINKEELTSTDGMKRIKSRIINKFKENTDTENEEKKLKTAIEEVFSLRTV